MIILRRRIKLINDIGVLLESFLGGIVEIVLFMVLLHNSVDNNLIPVIRAAILGSILANLLLCLGFCFFAGGLFREEQDFDEVVSEVGHGLLLMAGFGLLIPTAFYASLNGPNFPDGFIESKTLNISRITSVILLIAFFMYGAPTIQRSAGMANWTQLHIFPDANPSWVVRLRISSRRGTRQRPAFGS